METSTFWCVKTMLVFFSTPFLAWLKACETHVFPGLPHREALLSLESFEQMIEEMNQQLGLFFGIRKNPVVTVMQYMPMYR